MSALKKPSLFKKSSTEENIKMKREIELFQKKIQEKLKHDTATQKKAAQIIHDMIHGNLNKK